MGLDDVETAANLVQAAAHPDANIIFGASFDNSMEDEIRVIVIATGFDEGTQTAKAVATNAAASAESQPAAEQLFTNAEKTAEEKPAVAAEKESDEEDPFDSIFRIFNSK